MTRRGYDTVEIGPRSSPNQSFTFSPRYTRICDSGSDTFSGGVSDQQPTRATAGDNVEKVPEKEKVPGTCIMNSDGFGARSGVGDGFPLYRPAVTFIPHRPHGHVPLPDRSVARMSIFQRWIATF
jgi:hypothetical protein